MGTDHGVGQCLDRIGRQINHRLIDHVEPVGGRPDKRQAGDRTGDRYPKNCVHRDSPCVEVNVSARRAVGVSSGNPPASSAASTQHYTPMTLAVSAILSIILPRYSGALESETRWRCGVLTVRRAD